MGFVYASGVVVLSSSQQNLAVRVIGTSGNFSVATQSISLAITEFDICAFTQSVLLERDYGTLLSAPNSREVYSTNHIYKLR